MEDLFTFDSTRPKYSMTELVIAGLYQLVLSQIITTIICKVIRIDVSDNIKNQKDKIADKWKKSGLSIPLILTSEILGTVIYTPFAEEIVFKMLLMKYILIRRYGVDKIIANFIQATVFSLIHSVNIINTKQDNKYTIVQMISCFVSGIIGGFFYIHFNSLVPSILAHVINNGFVVLDEIINYAEKK